MSELSKNAGQAEHPFQTEAKKQAGSKTGFVVLMLALTGLFAYLGNWQLERLALKNARISAVEQRVGAAPIPLPPLDEWVGFDPQTYDFRPVKVSGTFDHRSTVLVFTYLADARGRYSGPGYWVVAPLTLAGGGTVFVNRGFVPQAQSEEFKRGGAGPRGEVSIVGLARASEMPNTFTPGSDFPNRVEWVRNIDRLMMFAETDLGPVAPVYINADASGEGALPQGGETRLVFPNRHLEYALTWFSLAVLTPIMLIFWLWRAWRQRNAK